MNNFNSKPPAVLNPTNLNDQNTKFYKNSNSLKETQTKPHLYPRENLQNYEDFDFDENNCNTLSRRTSSWVKPTQDRIKNSFAHENKFSEPEIEPGTFSKREESKNSLRSNDFSEANKIYKTTNALAEEFRSMIKNDRENFLQEYGKLEYKLISLLEDLKK